jgi:hypothetical protein
MTAAKDNETLDHLLSVVNDPRNVRDLHRIAKLQDGRSAGGERLHRRANLPRYELGITIAEHFRLRALSGRNAQ